MLRPYFSRVFLLAITLSIIPAAAVAQRDGGGAEISLPAFSEKGFFGAERDKPRRATPAAALRLPAGFQAELLYTVPLDTQGSWVCLCVDPRGRLIASAQSGGLYRITLPEDGQSELKVEALDTPIRGAQGLVCAFGSLYAVASNQESALYRLRDTDGDDRYDEVRLLRRIEGDGEHGPHAVVAGPDGQSLYIVGGNGSQLSALPETSRYPGEPREDRLLRRIGASDGEFTAERPGGWICRTDPEGRDFEQIAFGLRNAYDLAFRGDGELFTFDSDMEWDLGTPWYRPTRICHVVSGADFGWRAGTAKWPDDYFDSVGAVVDVGLGSPTGLAFGAGARFPAKFQRALFAADWSMGNIYAVHLEPNGATYRGTAERFVSGAPLPVTDLAIRPQDGALYFLVGGRGVTSALYRVRYVGDEPTATVAPEPLSAEVEARRTLETHHRPQSPGAVDAAWPFLGHRDRALRYAARLAIEHQAVDQWRERAMAEREPRAAIAALLALVHCSASDEAAWSRLGELGRLELPAEDRTDLARLWMVALARWGRPIDPQLWQSLDAQFPTGDAQLDRTLAEVLVFLRAAKLPERLVPLLEQAPSQELSLHYAHCLGDVAEGWTPALLRRFLAWHEQAREQRGGVTFGEYQTELQARAVALLPERERDPARQRLRGAPSAGALAELAARPLVRQWAPADILPLADDELAAADRRRGAEVFAQALCFRCHRLGGQGGATGPDLTSLAGRFNTADLLEAVLQPSRHVSDQYRTVALSLADGRVVTGKVKDISGNTLLVTTDPFDPGSLVMVPRDQIDELRWSESSPMPAGLLDSFTREEVVALAAFLLQPGAER